MIEIEICGRNNCLQTLLEKPQSLILIGQNKGTDKYIFEHTNLILKLDFDDIFLSEQSLVSGKRSILNNGCYILPTKTHILSAVNWCADKTNVIIACESGIRRSPAMAYIIGCIYNGGPKEAIKILDRRIHYPNDLMIQLASWALENDNIWDTYIEWLNNENAPNSAK